MVKRQISQREVTTVNPYQSGDMAGTLGSLLGQAKSQYVAFKEKQDIIKMNDSLADSSFKIMEATNEWKVKNEGDPLNDEALKDLDYRYDKILSGYDKDVSVISRGKWISAKNKIKNQQKDLIATWGIGQVTKNAENTMNKGIEKANFVSHESGKNLDYNTMQTSLMNQIEAIQASEGIFSKQVIDETVENFRSDHIKSYIAGMIQTDPARADKMLKDKNIRKEVGSADAINTLKAMVKKKKTESASEYKETQRVNSINIGKDLIEDSESHSLSELQKMNVLGEIDDKTYNRLLDFKTTKTYGNTVDPVSYNEISTMIVNGESAEDVGKKIMSKSLKLTKEAANSLAKSVTKTEDEDLSTTHKIEADGLKALLTRTVGFYGETKSVDEIMYDFNNEVRNNKANPESIRAIAQRYKDYALKAIDPDYEPEEVKNKSRVAPYDVGTTITNKSTGEKQILTKENGWVPLSKPTDNK